MFKTFFLKIFSSTHSTQNIFLQNTKYKHLFCSKVFSLTDIKIFSSYHHSRKKQDPAIQDPEPWTPNFVNGPFVTLCETVDLTPSGLRASLAGWIRDSIIFYGEKILQIFQTPNITILPKIVTHVTCDTRIYIVNRASPGGEAR